MSEPDSDNPLDFGPSRPDPGAHDRPKTYAKRGDGTEPEPVEYAEPRKYARRDDEGLGCFYVSGSPAFLIIAIPVLLVCYFFAAIFLIQRRRDLTGRQRFWRYAGVVALAAAVVGVPSYLIYRWDSQSGFGGKLISFDSCGNAPLASSGEDFRVRKK